MDNELIPPQQCACSFKKIFIYLKVRVIQREERQREREREREREVFHPMVHSPIGCNGRSCVNPKPGASSGSPMRVQGSKDLGHLVLLSQAIAESWIGIGAART